MEYKKVSLLTSDSGVRNILIALLSEDGYDGFEEEESALIAYISNSSFHEKALIDLVGQFGLKYLISDIAMINWNRTWEESFEPVVVDDFCTVRAHFHDVEITTSYEVIITPKMSFGTGHHATTQLMIGLMRRIDFLHRSVLDFGTGTGILSILSSKLGASEVLGIDNEEWAVENAVENIRRNEVRDVRIQLGFLEDIGDRQFDIILANINRHILLQYMTRIYLYCSPGGDVLLSGLLVEDRGIIVQSAREAGLILLSEHERSNWIALWFQRPHLLTV